MLTRLVVLLTGVVLVASGCSTPDEPDARSSAPAAAPPSATPVKHHRKPTRTRTPSDPAAPVSTAAAPVVASSSPPTVEPCRAGDLGPIVQTLRTLRPSEYGTSRYAEDYVLTNVSASACSLSGWPGFTMRGDRTVRDCGPTQPRPCGVSQRLDVFPQDVQSTDDETTLVVLEPGRTTSFSSIQLDGMICLHPPLRLDVVVAAGDRPITLAEPIVCGDSAIEITPYGVLAS